MKKKILTIIVILALFLPPILTLMGCSSEDSSAFGTVSGSNPRLWVSPDGVEYWVVGEGRYRMMAVRYNTEGEIVVHESNSTDG